MAIDAGDSIPIDARAFSGIGMMGGPMSVYETLTWIEPVSRLLRDAVAHEVPIIGHCLGGQLLAQALGATVSKSRVPEIGWIDVVTTDPGAAQTWFGGRERFVPFQWHYDVFELPPGATRVLTNPFNPNQGYVIG
ncbi:MAG TPA: type 1 glutamine amidotransferase, partial [Casimicrobiaceae bacterium]|nr:type 1 glutamine amidotransferase [Casimicrobiaceae bacterium]